MKKTIVLLMAVCCLLVSCGKDDTQGSKKGRDFLDGSTWVYDFAAEYMSGGGYTAKFYIEFSSGKATFTSVAGETGSEEVDSLGATPYTIVEDNWIIFDDFIPIFDDFIQQNSICFDKTAKYNKTNDEITVKWGMISDTNSLEYTSSFVFKREK